MSGITSHLVSDLVILLSTVLYCPLQIHWLKLSLYATFYAPILAVCESCGVQFMLIQGLPCAPSNLISQINLIIVQRSAESSRLRFRYIPVAWYDSLGAFTHKKDRDFHRD